MERGSSKHGPHKDELLKHDMEGAVRGRRGTRAEEWRDPEPSGEDQPELDTVPGRTRAGGTPPGMTERDVEFRTELASYLGHEVYPVDRDTLVEVLEGRNAPEHLVDAVSGLPEGQKFETVNDVVKALGRGVEEHRF